MLSEVMYDVGHVLNTVRPRAQTIAELAVSSFDSQPHRRFLSRPFALQVSQFQPALFPN
jgi:hypothetical protein